jgi:hypothetical protein
MAVFYAAPVEKIEIRCTGRLTRPSIRASDECRDYEKVGWDTVFPQDRRSLREDRVDTVIECKGNAVRSTAIEQFFEIQYRRVRLENSVDQRTKITRATG